MWALGLGFGLALYGIHWADQPGLDYIFLPQLGFIIIMMCLVLYFMGLKKKPDFGPKFIWIPMLVIVASLFARLAVDFSQETLAGALFGVVMFAIYLASRELGKDIFIAFIPFVVIVALSCIGYGIANPGETTGGMITNYCASCGFMIFGLVVNKFKWQWVLLSLVLVALFITGAAEALFAVGVFGVVILVRRDWSKKILLPAGLLITMVVAWTALGNTQNLYAGDGSTIDGIKNRIIGMVTLTKSDSDI